MTDGSDPGRGVLLIALGGLPGVGKSTIGTLLARRIGAVHIRIDAIEQAMRNAGLKVSRPEGYLAARSLAEDNLRSGHTVIVDSVNPIAITRNYWHATAARVAIDLVEIEVVCSDKRQHRQRVESRVSDVYGLVLPTWQQVLDRRYEPWTTAHVVDTSGRSLEETLSQVGASVRQRQPLRLWWPIAVDKHRRRGTGLILVFDPSQSAFGRTVENTTRQTLCAVRVEMHLSSGLEPGPAPKEPALRPENPLPGSCPQGEKRSRPRQRTGRSRPAVHSFEKREPARLNRCGTPPHRH